MPRKYVLKNPASPEVRRERAQKARAAQLSVEHYVQKIVDRAPELTSEHLDKLRSLLVPAGGATE
ncbi:hypothetical protein ACIRPU_02095 [Streptomyces sp. NPDC102259]|uniref:hypothetical protein n=1 Tax=Streptomyces sp. NPDC102259 TaxID=3366148 RepID=UPI0037F7BB87